MPVRSAEENDNTDNYLNSNRMQTTSLTNTLTLSRLNSEETLDSILKTEPKWADRYVMLVCALRPVSSYKVEKRWREFSLPLELHKVESWANLTAIRFYEVSTYSNSLSNIQANRNRNFVNYKRHIVNDRDQVDQTKLVHGHCYMVCGNQLSSLSSASSSVMQAVSNVPDTEDNNSPPALALPYNDIYEEWTSDGTTRFFQSSPIEDFETHFPSSIVSLPPVDQTLAKQVDSFFENEKNSNNNKMTDDEDDEDEDEDEEGISERDVQAFMTVTGADDSTAYLFLEMGSSLDIAFTIFYEVLNSSQSPALAIYDMNFTTLTPQNVTISFISDQRIEKGQNASLQSELLQAIKSGNLEKLNVLMPLSGIDLKYFDDKGDTLLMIAARFGYPAIVSRLLQSNDIAETINYQDIVNEWTALHFSAGEGNEECFKTLLSYGADPALTDHDRSSILHQAASFNNIAIVRACLENVTNSETLAKLVKQTLSEGETPLCIALAKGYTELAQVLTEIAALDCGAADIDGYTPLILAAKKNYLDVVKSILNTTTGYQSINRSTKTFGKTALIYAAKRGHLAVTQELIDRGANLNIRDAEDYSAVMYALEAGNLDIVKLLLDNDCDIQKATIGGITFIEYCTIHGYTDILSHLNETGVDLNNDDEDTPFPLYLAVASNEVETVRTMLSMHSVEISNQTTVTRESALHKACSIGNLDIVRELLKFTVDINTQDAFGRTALHIANYYKRADIAVELLNAGADPTIRDLSGICAGVIDAEIANNSLLVNPDEVKKIQCTGSTHPKHPKGQVFEATFRNKTVELTEYRIYSSEEAVSTYKRLTFLQQNLPQLYNKVSPTIAKAESDETLFTIFPRILAFYFDTTSVGIVQELPPTETAPLTVQPVEGKNTLLKMDLSISFLLGLQILHQNGILHGNIGSKTMNRTPLNFVIMRSFGLPCTVDHFTERNNVAPEVLDAGVAALTEGADVFSAGVTLFELFYQQKYDPNKLNYDINPAQVSIPPKINMIIIPMLRADLELRARLSIALEAFIKYRGELVNVDDLAEDVPDMIREVQSINIQNHVFLARFTRTRAEAYSFADRKVLYITYGTSAQLIKCVAKIKECMGDISLTSNETKALDDLVPFLSGTDQATLGSELVTDATYSMFSKLFQMNDQFMILDLFRLFVLKPQILAETLIHHSSVLEGLFTMLKQFNDLSLNAKMMISRVLCNLSADENGRKYLSLSKHKELIMASIRLGLLVKGENEKTLAAIRLAAASTALNLRYDIHQPASLDSISPNSSKPELSAEMKKYITAMLLSLKTRNVVFASDILVNLATTLYSLMKRDDLVLDMVHKRSDLGFESDIQPQLESTNSTLASAFTAMLSLKNYEV